MHGINTIIGKVVSFPLAKETITKNSRIVTFFNASHYWGGQLDEIASGKGVTRGLKTNTESRFYALILQALSVKDHRASLIEFCSRDGAQRTIGGLTPVNKDVISTVFDLAHWRMTCRKLAVSKATHSRKLGDAYRIALDIAKRWKWSKEMAKKLTSDLKAYHNGLAPFAGGKSDGKDWWTSLLVGISSHLLKALAIKIFSIVPHAAEVEHFFSSLGGFQTAKRSHLTIPHMQTFGTLRSDYVHQLHEVTIAAGKFMRRKHAHMHTPREGSGINVGRVDDLYKDVLWTPQLLTGYDDADIEGPELITLEDIDAEFNRLDEQLASAADGDGLASTVPIDQVYDLSMLDAIRARDAVPISIDDEIRVTTQSAAGDAWDPASLLHSLGV
jgi:hypothetical protein